MSAVGGAHVMCDEINAKIEEMGRRRFGVNYSPMKYRLQDMKIVEKDLNKNI